MGTTGWDAGEGDSRPVEARQMHRVLRTLIDAGDVDPAAPTLALFAGEYDRRVFDGLGFTDVSYTNITTHGTGLGTEADMIDAASLPEPDNSYDLVLAHAGIHHCSRPHQAVCEMYRVARRHAVFFENQDSLVTRGFARVGLMPSIEEAAVEFHDFQSGGVDGTGTPNHIYRWTRREVRKLIWSLDPPEPPEVRFFTEWDIELDRIKGRLERSAARRVPAPLVGGALRGTQRLLNRTLARQGNLFAAVITKRSPSVGAGAATGSGGVVTGVPATSGTTTTG
jgi:SAM-dependent methyltransferase